MKLKGYAGSTNRKTLLNPPQKTGLLEQQAIVCNKMRNDLLLLVDGIQFQANKAGNQQNIRKPLERRNEEDFLLHTKPCNLDQV